MIKSNYNVATTHNQILIETKANHWIKIRVKFKNTYFLLEAYIYEYRLYNQSNYVGQSKRMNDMNEEQYEQVLKYMETAREDNFEAASVILQQHNFDLQQALQAKFNETQPRNRRQNVAGMSDEEIVRKYVQYVQKRNEEWSLLGSLFGLVKTLIFATLGLFTRLLPESLRIRYFGGHFQRLYQGKLPSLFTARSLPYLLKQTKNITSKTVLVLVSPVKAHPHIISFLSREDLQKQISRNFYLTGHIFNHPQLAKVQKIQPPELIALRQNLFEQLVEVGRTKQIDKFDGKLLDRWAHQSRNLFKRDCNVIIKYRNFISRAFGHYYEQEEQEEVNLVDVERNTQQIRQQNRAYEQMEEQVKKMKLIEEEKASKQQEEQQRLQQIQVEREARKSSIPEEPTQGNIVRLSFRCPNGTTIIRNFHLEDKLDLVFHWVQLNDEIEFQDAKRHFQIMHSYPPAPLSSRRQELLSQIFDSPQEKLVIRQL